MKNGWPVKRLGDLSNLITKGTTPTSVGHAFVPEGINFVKVESISENGQFIQSKLARITQECHNALRRSQLKSGDILFSIAGALGRTAFVTDDILPANTNQALAIIRLKKSDGVSTEFVLKALSTGIVLEQIEKFKGGVAQQNLSLAQVQEFSIPIPPLPEQQRIVGILDEAFEGIALAKANAEKTLQNARALFESHLQSVFTQRGEGWVEKPLGEICSLITDGKHGDCRNEENSGYYFLSAKDVKQNTLSFENARQITKGDFQETHRRTNLKPYDICMVNTGATIGKLVLAPDDPRTLKATFQKSVAVIKPISSIIDNSYCCYHLRADLTKLVNVSSGSAQKNLLIGDLRRHVISLPPLEEQESIVLKLDRLSEDTQRLESNYRRKLAALEALRKSLLNLAFSGQL